MHKTVILTIHVISNVIKILNLIIRMCLMNNFKSMQLHFLIQITIICGGNGALLLGMDACGGGGLWVSIITV